MTQPLLVISLDGSGRVRRTARLRPGGLFVDLGARWIAEVPESVPPPSPGMLLAVLAPPSRRTGDRMCRHT